MKATYEITAKMNLKGIIAESREVAQALNEFTDNLESIEGKYASEEKPLENIITERLESVRCEICDKYCKFQADTSMDEVEFGLICEKCPLTRL